MHRHAAQTINGAHMRETVYTVPLREQDRVAVTKDGRTVKARVATVEGDKIGVTFAKGETPTIYDRNDVVILYGRFGDCQLPANQKETPAGVN